MSGLTTAELRRALEVVDAAQLDQPGEPMPWTLLNGIAELVQADGVSYCEQDPYAGQGFIEQDTAGYQTDDETAAWFWSIYWDSPCAYPQRTGDRDAILSARDFLSEQQWGSDPMTALTRSQGLHDDLVMSLIPSGPLDRRLVIWRTDGPVFGERERLLLALLRPHLLALHRQVLAKQSGEGAQSLTPRQRELLRMVAAGFSNAQAARRLGISEGTVRKHLEHSYARLGVTNRVSAVAQAFPLDASA